MTEQELRDQFAMAALQGMVCCSDMCPEDFTKLTAQSYVLADAMLKARETTND